MRDEITPTAAAFSNVEIASSDCLDELGEPMRRSRRSGKNYAFDMATAGRTELDGRAQASTRSSDPHFLTLHALRIKGFAEAETVADIVDRAVDLVEQDLAQLAHRGLAAFREARALWQLTPEGRSAHRSALAGDVKFVQLDSLAAHYDDFLNVNARFKALCGNRQLREDRPNDHSDSRYDESVIARLSDLDRNAQSVIASMAAVLPRLASYARRLDSARRGIEAGLHQMFTGVMCGSYHDIWMELHQDLILTQGIDRSAEGSY